MHLFLFGKIRRDEIVKFGQSRAFESKLIAKSGPSGGFVKAVTSN